MERHQIENLYKSIGIKDYQLRNIEDLLNIHSIDFKNVKGYNKIDDLNRAIYEKYIINFFNGLGLDSRATLIPKAIYWVEDTTYLVKDNTEDDYFTVAGVVVKVIDRNGLKTVLRKWTDKENENCEVVEGETTNYLRFEYEHDGREEWLHVTKEGTEWY